MTNQPSPNIDPDRWRSRKTVGTLRDLNQHTIRQFKALILVHRWELWRNAENGVDSE